MPPSTASWRGCVTIVVATLSMAVLSLAPAAAAKACKGGKTLVTVNRHGSCRPAKAVLPRPKAGDPVRAAVAAALSFTPRATGHKRPKTLAGVLGKRRATTVRRKLLKALPTLLSRLPSAGTARAAALVDPCSAGAHDFHAERGGVGLGLSKGQATLTMDAGPLSAEVSFPGGVECNRFSVPPCPTAAGVVDGHDDRSPEIRVVISDRNEVLYSATFRDTGHTELHGQVAADALLDELVVTDTLRHVVRLGGAAQGFTYTENGTVDRSLRVDMRTGAQTTLNATAHMIARLDGRNPGASYQENEGYKLLVKSGPEYVGLVDKATKRYRALETGWNADGACAAIDWSPASGALKLHRGDHGRAAATIRAKAGGTAAGAIASVTGQAGGTFAPQQAHSPTPGFDYMVTADSGVLTLSIRATSTAGVASASWTEPIVPLEWPVKRIAGTFSGVDHQDQMTTSWSGSATWVRAPNLDEGNTDRVFTLSSGTYTATVSGRTGGCTITGQKQFTIPASPTVPSIRIFNPAADVVFGAGKADWQLPWDYFWSTTLTSDLTWKPILSGCDDPNLDGQEVFMGAPQPTSGFPGKSTDGFGFAGFFAFPNPNSGETWNFGGTPTS